MNSIHVFRDFSFKIITISAANKVDERTSPTMVPEVSVAEYFEPSVQ